MNIGRLVFIIMSLSGLLIIVMVDIGTDTAVYTLEKVGDMAATSSSIIVATGFVLIGLLAENVLRRAERREKGLRPGWSDSDMDELEERVRKLEEKKDP